MASNRGTFAAQSLRTKYDPFPQKALVFMERLDINFKKFRLWEKHHLTPIKCSYSESSNSHINKKKVIFQKTFFFIGKDFKSVSI